MCAVEIPVVPDDLKEIDQWVLWRMETHAGKATKVPYTTRGVRASSTRPGDCVEFAAAWEAFQKRSQFYRGLGFVFFAEDPFVGVDLDDCLITSAGGEVIVKGWARGIVERFADTYMEVSPSGMGLKVWCRGSIPSNIAGVKCGNDSDGYGSIEMYDRARYFTVTGRRFAGASMQIEDHSLDITALHERLTGPRTASGDAWPTRPLLSGKIPHGQQHVTLISLAGTLRARRVCDAAILACLLSVNEHQCERPGPPANIERIVNSTRRWDGGKRS